MQVKFLYSLIYVQKKPYEAKILSLVMICKFNELNTLREYIFFLRELN